jgi:signal peptidase II
MLTRYWPFLVSLAIVLFDRMSKIGIRNSLSVVESVPVVPGWLRIIHTENPGAAFGMLAEGNLWLRKGILIGVSTLVMVFVAGALWNRRGGLESGLSRLALSLVLGGAAGNLIDRAFRGTVTDFIEVYHGAWSFPAFNVADSAITVGAVLLLLDLLRSRDKAERDAPQLVRQ